MIIKTRLFNKQSAHISDHKCISWVMHLSQYDTSQNESESKVSYLKKISVFVIKVKWHWSNDNNIQEKNRNIARKILSLIFSNKHQWHCKFIYILDNVIWFTHFRKWSEIDN